MGKILIFVSIVVTLLSAIVGFMNKGKLGEASEKVATAEAAAAAKQTELAKVQGSLKTTSESLATVTAEKDQLSAQISTIKSDLDKATAQAAEAAAAKTGLETQITQLQTEVQTKTAALEQATQNQAPVAQGPTEAQQAELAEKETLIAKLQQDLDSARTQLETLVTEKNNRMQLKMRNGLEGRILAVNPAWNFVVLNLGDKNGIVNNAELLVKRGTKLVGKVRITSVEPSTSIADIVTSSVPQGTSITPGDNVIYQSVEE